VAKTERFKYNNVLHCNKLNKIIISDASTLILLQKVALLDKLVKKARFIIPQEVYSEAIIKGKNVKSKDSYLIEDKITDNIIKVKNVKNMKKVSQIMSEFGLARGESEAIALFLEENADILAIDDHKAINICKIYKIPFMTALTFVINAHSTKLIMKNEAKEMIKNLGVYGRYKDELIYAALNYFGGKND
jgi:predicted nucleic acid-binding protein